MYLSWGCRRGWAAPTSPGDTWSWASCCPGGIRSRRRSGGRFYKETRGMETGRSGNLHVLVPEGESSSAGLQRSETSRQTGERVLEFSGRSPIFKTPDLPIPLLPNFLYFYNKHCHYKVIINLQFFKSKSLNASQTNMAKQTRKIFLNLRRGKKVRSV